MTTNVIKLSGSEELDFPLPTGWMWATLGEVLESVSKVNPQETPDKEFIYLDISSIDNATNRITEPKIYKGLDAPSRARQLVNTGDVLFSTVRTYLRNIAPVPEKYNGQIASTGFAVLRGNPAIVPGYLLHYVLTDGFLEELGKLQRGVSYPAVREDDVRSQPIPLAPLAEQKRIVDAIEAQFTRLDAAVAGLRRLRANLQRYRQSVLKAACEGRLVPTEAELARAEDRPFEDGATLLGRVLTERRRQWEADNRPEQPKNDKWKDKYREPAAPDLSSLPDLPDGWSWATVEQVSIKVQYGTSEKADVDFSGVPVLRMGNIQNGRLDFSDLKYLPDGYKELDKYLLEPGDVLFNRTNSAELVGKTAVYQSHHQSAAFASYLIRVKTSKYYHPELLTIYINSVFGRDYIASVVSQQVGQANVNGTKLSNMFIPLPPLAEQERIVEEVERRLSVIEQHEQVITASLKRAERLRQSILKRAFAGQLV